MIRALLWDVDGTLLNFKTAERRALGDAFLRFGLGRCTEEMLARYSVLNDRWWKRLERGEVTKAELLTGRFRAFFRAEGVDCTEYDAFNDYYQIRLGETVVFQDEGYDLVRSLAGRVGQYAVTNGTVAAQRRKLKNSGLDILMDGVFISEEVGADKPAPAFFDRVLSAIPACPREEILIVGDSLTSDMKGGNLAGIRCCWYDPQDRPLPEDLTIAYHIRDLRQVREILVRENGPGFLCG